MLPRPLRVSRTADHRLVLRQGRRARAGSLTVHLLTRSGDGPARCGLVVGRAVGNSVLRHRVSRQLRALLADRVSTLPSASMVIVRAGPGAAGTQLAGDLDAALRRALLPAPAKAQVSR